jgi:NAD(P)-dependent dehydrogenase (short-subunit alcohol dehydrogenase family)
MSYSIDLSGRIALVTGASAGLGVHFARILAAAGATVIAAARRVEALEATVESIRAAGGQARPVALDVQDAAAIADVFARIGTLDILVNNAGISRPALAVDDTPANFDAVFDTNARGAYFTATAAAKAMRGKGGSIVNIASILGLRQDRRVASYAMSKAAVIQMTKVLALEFAPEQVRVNAIAPGYFLTDINRDFLGSEHGRAMIARIPQRRVGDPSDLDGPLLLLASDASRFMTGSVLAVDGGHLLSPL